VPLDGTGAAWPVADLRFEDAPYAAGDDALEQEQLRLFQILERERRQAEDEHRASVERENGAPLDTEGDFYDGTPIHSPADLNSALLQRPLPLVRTFVENLMAYGLGRRVEFYDQPTVREISQSSEAENWRMQDLILGVVESDAFRMKRAAPAATDEQTMDDTR